MSKKVLILIELARSRGEDPKKKFLDPNPAHLKKKPDTTLIRNLTKSLFLDRWAYNKLINYHSCFNLLILVYILFKMKIIS